MRDYSDLRGCSDQLDFNFESDSEFLLIKKFDISLKGSSRLLSLSTISDLSMAILRSATSYF